jgi:gluconolactonase
VEIVMTKPNSFGGRFLTWIAGTAFTLAAIGRTLICLADEVAKPSKITYENLQTEKYLGPVEVLATVEDKEVFTEGPAVDRQGRVLFTNVPASKILMWDPAAKKLSTFRENTNQTNGLVFDAQERLIMCEGVAGRLTRLDPKSGEVEVLAEKFNDFPLAAPNDACLDAKGRIYFSSRPGAADASKGNVNAVYRLDPDGKLTQLLAYPKIHMPNGLDISPDGKTLYIVESHPEADHHRDLRAFDLADDGTVSNERVLIDFHPGRSGDGLCFDAAGNLYVAAGLHKTRNTSETLSTRPGIHVISPAGKLLAFRETPEDTITNCTLSRDGKTLFVTCGTKLLSIAVLKPPKP